MTDVRATGLQSFNTIGADFLGMGIIVDFLKQFGITHSSRDQLKIDLNTGASWYRQSFTRRGLILSGPGAFFSLSLAKERMTSCSETMSENSWDDNNYINFLTLDTNIALTELFGLILFKT